MQFIALDNYRKIQRFCCSADNTNGRIKIKDISNGDHSFPASSIPSGSNWFLTLVPTFLVANVSKSDRSQTYLYPEASSAEEIASSIYDTPNKVGTATISASRVANGSTYNITVVGSADTTIRHFVFKKSMYDGTYMYTAVIFAIKLDTPVELNAENNYTANFTFAIEF